MTSIEYKGHLQELRNNFFHFYEQGHNPNYDESQIRFQFELDQNSQIILPEEPTLLAEVERLRKHIIHPFRIRGTSTEFMDQAKQTGVLSAKKVSDWWEHDSGSVATYRVLPTDMRISNQEFLYLLQATTTGALRYGMSHNNWYDDLRYIDFVATDRTASSDDRLTQTGKLFAKRLREVPDSAGVEIVACLDTPFYPIGQRYVVNKMLPELEQKGKFVDTQIYGSYLGEWGEGDFVLGDRPVTPFRENGFDQQLPLEKYSPVYCGINRYDFWKMFGQIRKTNSSERQVFERMKSEDIPGGFSVADTMVYLLGEKLTLEMMNAMRSWYPDNQALLKYSDKEHV